jgi:hypothetical protein
MIRNPLDPNSEIPSPGTATEQSATATSTATHSAHSLNNETVSRPEALSPLPQTEEERFLRMMKGFITAGAGMRAEDRGYLFALRDVLSILECDAEVTHEAVLLLYRDRAVMMTGRRN